MSLASTSLLVVGRGALSGARSGWSAASGAGVPVARTSLPQTRRPTTRPGRCAAALAVPGDDERVDGEHVHVGRATPAGLPACAGRREQGPAPDGVRGGGEDGDATGRRPVAGSSGRDRGAASRSSRASASRASASSRSRSAVRASAATRPGPRASSSEPGAWPGPGTGRRPGRRWPGRPTARRPSAVAGPAASRPGQAEQRTAEQRPRRAGIPASDRAPEPRASPSSTVSAWSSRVWPSRTAAAPCRRGGVVERRVAGGPRGGLRTAGPRAAPTASV